MLLPVCATCGLGHRAGSPCPVPHYLPATGAVVPLSSGAVVGGRFTIFGVAHRSGTSTVYNAVDRRRQDQCLAIKEIRAEGLAGAEREETLAWLAREAGLLSTLRDPRLPTLVAAFSEGGAGTATRHFVVMPFLDGQTLEEVLDTAGPQPERRVLDWAWQLADLLTFLHGQEPSVVHRDLKPANILLRPDGTIALLDLGVARRLPPGNGRGAVGTAVGTPGYAPPEQYQGLADERSDLYGLGATLHRLLTGYDPEDRPPFRHPAVRALRPEASEPAAALVDQLLALAPERRPPSAADVAIRLQALLTGPEARFWRSMPDVYRASGALLWVGTLLSVPAARAAWLSGPLGLLLLALCCALPWLPLLRPRIVAGLLRYPPLRWQGHYLAGLLGAWSVVQAALMGLAGANRAGTAILMTIFIHSMLRILRTTLAPPDAARRP